jgi:hypothetical protein
LPTCERALARSPATSPSEALGKGLRVFRLTKAVRAQQTGATRRRADLWLGDCLRRDADTAEIVARRVAEAGLDRRSLSAVRFPFWQRRRRSNAHPRG